MFAGACLTTICLAMDVWEDTQMNDNKIGAFFISSKPLAKRINISNIKISDTHASVSDAVK